MLLIGLTGSLATGKSTVSNLFRSPPYNLPIIDADVLARQVVEPGTYGYRRVISAFGPSTPDLLLEPDDGLSGENDRTGDDGPSPPSAPEQDSGTVKRRKHERPINRAALGRRVFGSTPDRIRDRKILNGIIHPLVRLAIVKALLYYYIRGHWAVLLDIPLLYESRLDVYCGVVVMVGVSDPVVQMRRLRERDRGLSPREAEERVASQMQVAEKVERTEARGRMKGKVVINDGTKEDLETEVASVFREIKDEGGGEWRRIWLWGNPLAVVVVGMWEIWRSWRARRTWEASTRKSR